MKSYFSSREVSFDEFGEIIFLVRLVSKLTALRLTPDARGSSKTSLNVSPRGI